MSTVPFVVLPFTASGPSLTFPVQAARERTQALRIATRVIIDFMASVIVRSSPCVPGWAPVLHPTPMPAPMLLLDREANARGGALRRAHQFDDDAVLVLHDRGASAASHGCTRAGCREGAVEGRDGLEIGHLAAI